MIPQFFVKSSGEQLNYDKFAYVAGAQLIYDWGNPLSYIPGQGSSGGTTNIASGSLGEPQGGFQQWGGGSAPLWSSAYSGSIDFSPGTVGNYYVEYNGVLPTGSISIVSVYMGGSDTGGSLLSLTGSQNGINLVMNSSGVITPTIWYGASGNTQATLSCTAKLLSGFNMITFASNGLNQHTMYLNGAISASVDTNTYNRGLFAPSARNIRIGENNINSGNNISLQGQMIATLVYPFALSPKQIRQLWYVFRKRFT